MQKSLSNIISTILNRSPFIQEAMDRELINITSLARYIKPMVDKESKASINVPAIVMAINRLPLSPSQQMDKSLNAYLSKMGDIIVRSDLVDFSFVNSSTLLQKQAQLLKFIDHNNRHFYSVSRGIYETTLVISSALKDSVQVIFQSEELVIHHDDLSAVSIMLPSNNQDIHGVYYTILKHIAWNGINIVEVISTANEITLVVSSDDVEKVFSLFNSLKKAP